jgi:glycosyltransferase involved in cell wall biosynthesis
MNIMKVAIFTGSINIQKESKDVRKLYILEKLDYFSSLDPDTVRLEVITPYVNEYDLPQFENIEYNTYKMINKKHLKMFSTSFYSMFEIFKLNCDLIHCYNLQAATIAWLINNFKKKKYFIIFEPMGSAYGESKYKNQPIKVIIAGMLARTPENLMFKKSDAIIVYTNIFKKFVSQNFGVNSKKIHVIQHGTNLNTQHEPSQIEKDSLRKKLEIPGANKIVMYAGSLTDLHGTPNLLEAINYVNMQKQNVSFLILGKGPLEKKIQTFIMTNKLNNVKLLGFVSSEKIGLYLSLSDILLIPHSKCLQTELDPPTKLFEYLASGKPIVAFNLAAIAEVVGNNAVLVDPDNPKALADGILKLLGDETLCKELGKNGRIISKGYSCDISAKMLHNLYIHLYESYFK